MTTMWVQSFLLQELTENWYVYKQYGQVTKFEIDYMELFYIRPKI